MGRMIFINLPVSDLARSRAFYDAIGAVNEPRFTNELAAAYSISEEIKVMLLSHEHWRNFTDKAIVDAHKAAQVSLCLACDSRAEVDAAVEAAVKAGGKGDPSPIQDYGVMYGRGYEDPDGHNWDVMWMDPAAAEQGASAIEAGMAAEDA